jgi:hypothetical protein
MFLRNIDSDDASRFVLLQPKNVLVAVPESAVENLIAFSKLGGLGEERSKILLCSGQELGPSSIVLDGARFDITPIAKIDPKRLAPGLELQFMSRRKVARYARYDGWVKICVQSRRSRLENLEDLSEEAGERFHGLSLPDIGVLQLLSHSMVWLFTILLI